MALRRKAAAIELAPAAIELAPAAIEDPQTLLSSAVRMTLSEQAWQTTRFSNYTDEAWQNEGWAFYDTNEQLHNAIDYIGAACSMIRIYVSEVDVNGVRQGEVSDNPEIAALAESLFGGPANKAEMLRGMGISLTVAGECYVIGQRAKPVGRSQWFVAAPSEVRMVGTDTVWVTMGGGVREQLSPGKDIIIRVWTPHPRWNLLSDSPVRACLGLLYEMQGLQSMLRAQINSRIANATILPVPSTLSTPRGDAAPVTNDDVYEQLYEVITSNLEGKGTAAQVAPILWQMPLAELEAMSGIQPIRFDSVLSDQAIDLRKECQMKLAIGINVPVEIQLGGREMNHWAIWWAGEEFIVKSIQPLMNRIVDALTTAYLVPALKKLKQDPSRYTYWYDTAPLAASANKLIDTLNLYKEGLVDGDTVRAAAAYNDSNKPSPKENAERFIKEVILRNPTLFTVDPVREAIDIHIDTAVAPLPELSTPPPPPPAPQQGITGPKAGQKPLQPAQTDDAADQGELIASLVPAASAGQVAVSNAALRILELAGKRLLTPSHRGMFPDTKPAHLHTKIRVAGEVHADKILSGAFDHVGDYLDGTGLTASAVQPILERYVKGLLISSVPHNAAILNRLLDSAGIR